MIPRTKDGRVRSQRSDSPPGVGKVRHLQVKQLWLQENVAAGELTIVKIPRAENYADALTHPWGTNDLPFWEAMGICFLPNDTVDRYRPPGSQ